MVHSQILYSTFPGTVADECLCLILWCTKYNLHSTFPGTMVHSPVLWYIPRYYDTFPGTMEHSQVLWQMSVCVSFYDGLNTIHGTFPGTMLHSQVLLQMSVLCLVYNMLKQKPALLVLRSTDVRTTGQWTSHLNNIICWKNSSYVNFWLVNDKQNV